MCIRDSLTSVLTFLPFSCSFLCSSVVLPGLSVWMAASQQCAETCVVCALCNVCKLSIWDGGHSMKLRVLHKCDSGIDVLCGNSTWCWVCSLWASAPPLTVPLHICYAWHSVHYINVAPIQIQCNIMHVIHNMNVESTLLMHIAQSIVLPLTVWLAVGRHHCSTSFDCDCRTT